MHLSEFFEYKNRLMQDLLTDDEIVNLLDPNHKYPDPKDMVYDTVNPYEFNPDTIEKGKVYLCCDVDVRQVGGAPYYTLALYVWVFCHKSLLPLPEGGVRVDALCNKIDEKINGSSYYGLGKLALHQTQRFAPMADYAGKSLTYYATDFNRFNNPNQKRPSNRREDRYES